METHTNLAEHLAERFAEEKEILKYKAVVDAAPTEMAVSNSVGQLIYANKSYLKLMECDSLEDVIGDRWVNIISDADRERVTREWGKFISNKVEKFYGLVEYKKLKENSTFQKRVICSKIENNGYGIYLMPPDFCVDQEFIEIL